MQHWLCTGCFLHVLELTPFSQAVAWCPWQSNVLATGGGTSDRHIRIWNVCSGTCLSAVDAHSQVRHEHSLKINTFWLDTYTELLAPEAQKHGKAGDHAHLCGEHQHKQLVLPALLHLPRSVLSCGQQTTRSSFQAMALHRINWLYGSTQRWPRSLSCEVGWALCLGKGGLLEAEGRCNPWFEQAGSLAWSITDAEWCPGGMLLEGGTPVGC